MRELKYTCLVLVLASFVISPAAAIQTKAYTLSDLVAEARLIAQGSIGFQGGHPFLLVGQFLKGTGNTKIKVGTRGIGLIRPAKFEEGEKVMLFLEAPNEDGVAYLVGYSDQGKWPQSYRSDGYGRADLPGLARAVDALNKALAGADFQQQANGIISMIQCEDWLIQLAGLDLALSETLSNSLPQYERAPARRQLAAFALPLLKSSDTAVRDRAIRLTENAPNTVAACALIPLITDPELRCRQHAKVALGRVVADCKIDDPDIDSWYKRRLSRDPDSPENRDAEEMKAKFEAAWASKREDRLAKDVSRLRASLNSASSLERTSAVLYLRYLDVATE